MENDMEVDLDSKNKIIDFLVKETNIIDVEMSSWWSHKIKKLNFKINTHLRKIWIFKSSRKFYLFLKITNIVKTR